jgi:polyferredoxin
VDIVPYSSIITDTLVSLLITAAFYLMVPWIMRHRRGVPYDKKQATKIALINSVVVFIVFTLIQAAFDQQPNILAAFIWFFIARMVLLGESNANTKKNI